jgi:Na+-transporting NADH:ubiquinone oxidoreductase subunit NqrB
VTRSPHMPAAQELHLRGRHVPVQVPRWGDPRLKLATVLLIVQVLGQTVLEFNLSIAQILVTIGVSAAIEMTVIFWRRRVLAWPASAMLTGNSVALLLRSSGTEHGDWWSLNGIEYFMLAAVLSLLSKYLIRARGKHLFNPSNVGLVWTFVLVGLTRHMSTSGLGWVACRVRCRLPMRPGRPGSDWCGFCPQPLSGARSWRPRSSSDPAVIGSRPTGRTRCTWRGCCDCARRSSPA